MPERDADEGFAEAERRIAEAKATHSTHLNLIHVSPKQIPKSIEQLLPQLTA
jgi:hypothetical protein